jgi:predicted transcriptional regulator
MNISQVLKTRREELNISQDALARHIGFRHRSSIHRLETGELEWKFRDVLKACEFLELCLTVEPV